jgi:1-phosphofructokinase
MNRRIATVTLNPAIDQTAVVSEFTLDAVNRVEWEQSDPGGKGVNVASFLVDLGHPVSATGLLGRDNPELFQQLFERKGIGDRFVRIDGRTRTNVKIVDNSEQQVTDLNFPGAVPTDAELQQVWAAIEQLMPDHDWFVLAGSLPKGVPVTIYRDWVAALKQAGKRVALDTSGAALQMALSAQPDLIKPNRVELEAVLRQELDSKAAIVRAAQSLIQQGISHIVVSLGEQGALFMNGHTAIHAQPPEILVKSTVGAGDAMVAGTVSALAQGDSLEQCARLGTACSMGALSRIGSNLPSIKEIAAYGDRVVLRDMAPVSNV